MNFQRKKRVLVLNKLNDWMTFKITIDVLSDVDIMKQLEDGKKKGTRVRDFEDLAKELGI